MKSSEVLGLALSLAGDKVAFELFKSFTILWLMGGTRPVVAWSGTAGVISSSIAIGVDEDSQAIPEMEKETKNEMDSV